MKISSGVYNAGLFSELRRGATVQNLSIENCDITGSTVGGLTAYVYEGDIIINNVSVIGNLKGDYTVGYEEILVLDIEVIFLKFAHFELGIAIPAVKAAEGGDRLLAAGKRFCHSTSRRASIRRGAVRPFPHCHVKCQRFQQIIFFCPSEITRRV